MLPVLHTACFLNCKLPLQQGRHGSSQDLLPPYDFQSTRDHLGGKHIRAPHLSSVCVVCTDVYAVCTHVCKCVHRYVYPCMDIWGSEEGLNHFLPLRQNPTLPFYLDWLASELWGSPVSAPQCSGFRHIHPCQVFMWVSGIQAWVLVLM